VEERASIRVGTDLTCVADVAQSIERFGDRYLRRIFTEHELASTGAAPERLAARFAAKEAAVKVLRPTGNQPDWRSIEVVRDGAGACHLRLTGTAAAMAADAGIAELAVSLTHEHDLAAAFVVARLTTDEEHAA
jgi:holo-[acyl-carrier protein] synthase